MASKLEWTKSIIAGHEQARIEPGWMFLTFTIRDYGDGPSLTIDNSEGWEEEYRGISVEQLKGKAQVVWDAMVDSLSEKSEPACKCHERDGSYSCDYCKSQGIYGHMERNHRA